MHLEALGNKLIQILIFMYIIEIMMTHMNGI